MYVFCLIILIKIKKKNLCISNSYRFCRSKIVVVKVVIVVVAYCFFCSLNEISLNLHQNFLTIQSKTNN